MKYYIAAAIGAVASIGLSVAIVANPMPIANLISRTAGIFLTVSMALMVGPLAIAFFNRRVAHQSTATLLGLGLMCFALGYAAFVMRPAFYPMCINLCEQINRGFGLALIAMAFVFTMLAVSLEPRHTRLGRWLIYGSLIIGALAALAAYLAMT